MPYPLFSRVCARSPLGVRERREDTPARTAGSARETAAGRASEAAVGVAGAEEEREGWRKEWRGPGERAEEKRPWWRWIRFYALHGLYLVASRLKVTLDRRHFWPFFCGLLCAMLALFPVSCREHFHVCCPLLLDYQADVTSTHVGR